MARMHRGAASARGSGVRVGTRGAPAASSFGAALLSHIPLASLVRSLRTPPPPRPTPRTGNIEDVERFSKRTVKMEKTHIEDCKRLLRLMGMPVVDAPCEVRRVVAAPACARGQSWTGGASGDRVETD